MSALRQNILIICLILLTIGCAAPMTHNEKREQLMLKAFEQVHAADLLIHYDGPTQIDIGLGRMIEGPDPRIRIPKYFSLISLSEHLDDNNIHEGSVVLVMSKQTQMQTPETFKEEVDNIEAYLRREGFKHIVFQLANAVGRPIYRETKFR